MVTITSIIDGYRRCGIEHPARPTEYPDKFFSPEQLAILKTTPVLLVQDDPNGSQQKTQEELTTTLDPDQLKKYTLADLKDIAAKMKLSYSATITKKELIGMICKEPIAAE